MRIRTNLAYLRMVRGKLTQRAVSDATGIGQKTLSALETGVSKGIEFSTLARLCEFLQCHPSELLILEQEPVELKPSSAALERADLLIAKGLSRAMDASPKSVQQLWSDFDAMHERLQQSAERASNQNSGTPRAET